MIGNIQMCPIGRLLLYHQDIHFVSFLSLSYHRFVLVLYVCSRCAMRSCVFRCSAYRFVVVGPGHYMHLSVCTTLCAFVPIICRILDKATSQRFFAMWKHSAASERLSQNDDVRRPSLRLQQNSFRAGKVEKGGDVTENNLVITLDNLG